MKSLENFKEIKKMSSREIAELTGKLHKHVLVDCDKLNDNYQQMGMDEISSVKYLADNGQQYREYKLTKMQTLDLVTGYDLKLRIKVNRRWEELENQAITFNPDSISRKQLAQMLLDSEVEKERLEVQNELQAKELKEAAPKLDYYKKVIQSDQAIRTTVIAKDLGMSAGRLNMLLHRMGIQYKVKGTWVLYSDHQGKGYTQSVTHYFTGLDGKDRTSILTCWTQKGREFIMNAVNPNSLNIELKKIY